MKNKILLIVFLLFPALMYGQEKIDLNKKPDPLPTSEFTFPAYKIEKLSNGIKVFVIEDHEQPTVNIELLIPGGYSVEGEKNSVADFTTSLLTKGTKTRTALQIAQSLDGVGAAVGASANIDYVSVGASCIKKHLQLTLDIMSDVLLNPTFPEDEFGKLMPQFLANVKQEKSSPSRIAAALARIVLYGEKHPYAKRNTEASLKNLKIEDIKKYYQENFIPNEATIAVIGDFKTSEIIPQLEKAFGSWKKGSAKKIKVDQPKSLPMGVYFVSRPSSVQSSVIVATKAIPYADPDYEKLDFAADMIGSGFAGRLFKTLRETYSYTYTPFGYLTKAKYVNRFACGADVRNTVTDSAINVIKEQLHILNTEMAKDDEINRLKKYNIGQFYTSFESSEYIATMMQKEDFMGSKIEKLKDYPKRLMAMSPAEIMNVSAKYMDPENAYIIVCGSPEIKEKLAKYGKIYEYDLDLNPASGETAKFEKVSLDPKELMEKCTEAIGGSKAIEKIQTLVAEGKVELEMQGMKMPGSMVQKTKAPNKQYMSLDLGMFKQISWIDGVHAVTKGQGQITRAEGKELEKQLHSAILFNETQLVNLKYKCTILGKQNGNIVMKAVSPLGNEATYYFDAKTYLLNKTEAIEMQGDQPNPITTTYSNYTKFNDVLLPKVVKTETPMFVINVDTNYQVNIPVEDETFVPEKE